jgi:hypothetical protein
MRRSWSCHCRGKTSHLLILTAIARGSKPLSTIVARCRYQGRSPSPLSKGPPLSSNRLVPRELAFNIVVSRKLWELAQTASYHLEFKKHLSNLKEKKRKEKKNSGRINSSKIIIFFYGVYNI